MQERPINSEGNGPKETSSNLEKRLENWTNEVKSEIGRNVLGATQARTNFRIDVDDSGNHIVKPRDWNKEGYNSEGMNRGMDEWQADRLYHAFNALRSVKEIATDTTTTKEQELYIAIVKPNDIKDIVPGKKSDVDNMLRPLIGDRTVLEFRYKQLKADAPRGGIPQDGTKCVYLAVPDNLAKEMQQMIEKGVDPNKVRASLAEIFTDEKTRDFFDATLVDTSGDTPLITTMPKHATFEKTVIVSKGETKTIEPTKAQEVSERPTIKKLGGEKTDKAPAKEPVWLKDEAEPESQNSKSDAEKYLDSLRSQVKTMSEKDVQRMLKQRARFSDDVRDEAVQILQNKLNQNQGETGPQPTSENKTEQNIFSSVGEFRKNFIPKIQNMSFEEVQNHLELSNLFTDDVKDETVRALEVRRDAVVSEAAATNLGELGDIWNQLNALEELQAMGYLDREDVKELVRNFGLNKYAINSSRDNIEEEYKSVWDYARQRIDERLSDLRPTQTQTHPMPGATPDLAGMVQAQIETARQMGRSADVQERMYELSLRSYKDYTEQEYQRAQLDPYQFLRDRPGWFRSLSPDFEQNERMQRVIDFRNRLAFSARLKQEKGPLSLEASTHPEAMEWRTDVWDDMWMEMPGHRAAFISMFRENFELDRDKKFIVLTEQGKENFRNFGSYKRRVVHDLETYLMANPNTMNTGGWADNLRIPDVNEDGTVNTQNDKREKKAQLLATAAVATVSNMFFVGGAAESGMETRDIHDKEVESEQFRAFMHPKIKAIMKAGADSPFTAEEWGGAMGNWYVQGTQYADGFATKDRSGKENREETMRKTPNYFPPRLFCSIFEMAEFGEGRHKGENFATAILNLKGEELLRVGNGRLVDISSPESLRPGDLDGGELWGGLYGDVMDSATKVFSVMTGRQDKDFTASQLANALAKARKNKVLEDIYTDEDLLMACVVGLCGGPMPGSYRKGGKEFLVNVPLENYDHVIDLATKEPRLFITGNGKNKGVDIRKNILRRLKSEDMSHASLLAEFRIWSSTFGVPVTERAAIYNEAIANQARMRRQQHFNLKT